MLTYCINFYYIRQLIENLQCWYFFLLKNNSDHQTIKNESSILKTKVSYFLISTVSIHNFNPTIQIKITAGQTKKKEVRYTNSSSTHALDLYFSINKMERLNTYLKRPHTVGACIGISPIFKYVGKLTSLQFCSFVIPWEKHTYIPSWRSLIHMGLWGGWWRNVDKAA